MIREHLKQFKDEFRRDLVARPDMADEGLRQRLGRAYDKYADYLKIGGSCTAGS